MFFLITVTGSPLPVTCRRVFPAASGIFRWVSSAVQLGSVMETPSRNYDYSRAGVLAITLKCREGIWLCRISQDSYTLLPIGKAVQEQLLGIPKYYPQIKIGQYQIMPDHVHVMVHVVKDLPKLVTVRTIFRGMKAGVDRLCKERLTGFKAPVFQEGLFDRIIRDDKMLAQEVAYIRDNVRRYRLRKTKIKATFERQTLFYRSLQKFGRLWYIGNYFLLEAPQIQHLQFSRSLGEDAWPEISRDLIQRIQQGVVFVSPFISPFERRALAMVLTHGGRVVRITMDFFGERYKPLGMLFDAYCEGRVLEISARELFPKFMELDRNICAKMREIAETIAKMPPRCGGMGRDFPTP